MENNYWILFSKKVIHKAAEATGEFLGNKITDTVAKLYDDKIEKTKHVEEMLFHQKKQKEYQTN